MKKKVAFYLVLYIVVIFFVFAPSYSRYYRMKTQLATLKSDIVRLKKENKALARKLEQIENDAGMLEEIARRKYRMGAPGEIIYIISADSHDSGPSLVD